MVEYRKSDRLEKVAKKVMSEMGKVAHLDDSRCRIAYQTSDQQKKKNGGTVTVYADTTLVPEKLKAFIPYDFVITFYWPNCETLSEDKLEKLMYHELRHVGFTSEGKFSLIPHDIEDFRDIVDSWGINWL